MAFNARNSVLFLMRIAERRRVRRCALLRVAARCCGTGVGRPTTRVDQELTPKLCSYSEYNKKLFYYVFIKSEMMYVYNSLFRDCSSIVYGLAYEVTN